MATSTADAPTVPDHELHRDNYTAAMPGQLDLFAPADVAPPSTSTVTRFCHECRRYRPLDEFNANRFVPSGYGAYCTPCRTTRARRRRGVAHADARRQPAPGQRCEICSGLNDGRPLFLDHDHSTGAFRGWLCNRCNTLLGFALDHPDILTAAIDYLRRAAA